MVVIGNPCWVHMPQKVKISAKIDADLWERVQDYEIDFSKVIRNSLEAAVKDKEIEDLIRAKEKDNFVGEGLNRVLERRVRE